MSNFLQLFTRQGAVLLFIALEIICFYLIITYNEQQSVIADSTWSLYSGKFKTQADIARRYLTLEDLNAQLREENAELLSQLPNAQYVETLDTASVQDDSLRQRYSYIGAKIINKSPLSGNITYVLDRGHIHGVEPNQGVINSKGVVGIVSKVAQRHCRVMSLMHSKFRLSAGLRGSPFFGSLYWNGGDTREAILSSIPEYAGVAPGDTIETTGYSNIFPTGVALGIVKEVVPQKSDNTLDCEVNLFLNFFTIESGYIVRDLLKEDLDQLDINE